MSGSDALGGQFKPDTLALARRANAARAAAPSAPRSIAYHGTSVAHARSIIANGARPGLWAVNEPAHAHGYREIAEKHLGGGVTIEGELVGRAHQATGDPHSPQHWKDATASGASHINNRGLITTVEHGAFVPKRLHYPDGRVEDVNA